MYYQSKKYNLQGTVNPDIRIHAIKPLLHICKNMSILDLGCAEGLIGMEFIKNGASLVQGFDINKERIKEGNRINEFPNLELTACDIANWEILSSYLSDSYDVVLMLGVYHHLPEEKRKDLLIKVINLQPKYFAFRANQRVCKEDNTDDIISKKFNKTNHRFIWELIL